MNKTYYQVNGWSKFSEVDNYKEGCDPETTNNFCGLVSDSVDGIIKRCMEFVGAESLDSCEEEGRLDIQVMETDEGIIAGDYDIKAWKKGSKRLWLCCYTFNVSLINEETVSLLKTVTI